MKLFFTETSPFVRKVRVAAAELGLADRLQLEFLRPSPLTADPGLSKLNPLSKIPALVLPDGSALYDSAVICDYLDSLTDARPMCPRSGPERFANLRIQALADGTLEACVLVFYETMHRPKELHYQAWLDGQTQKATQGLDELERMAKSFGTEPDLGQICAAVTMGWLDFRKPIGDVRANRPALSAWFDQFNQRPSMQSTAPVVRPV
jgi:glutathione S-transferase